MSTLNHLIDWAYLQVEINGGIDAVDDEWYETPDGRYDINVYWDAANQSVCGAIYATYKRYDGTVCTDTTVPLATF